MAASTFSTFRLQGNSCMNKTYLMLLLPHLPHRMLTEPKPYLSGKGSFECFLPLLS